MLKIGKSLSWDTFGEAINDQILTQKVQNLRRDTENVIKELHSQKVLDPGWYFKFLRLEKQKSSFLVLAPS